MPPIRLRVFLFFVALFWFLVASPAGAHTGLQSSTPADGSAVDEPVELVSFVFTDVIEVFVDGYTLTTLDGQEVLLESVEQIDLQTVEVRLHESLTEPFVATWAVVAEDSHPITGSIVVNVIAAEPTNVPTPTVLPVIETAVPIPTATPEATRTPAPTPTVSPYPEIDYVGLEELEEWRDARAKLNLEIIDGQAKAEKIWLGLRWATYLSTATLVGGLFLASSLKGDQRERYWSATRPVLYVSAGVLVALTVLMVGLQLASLTGMLSDILRVSGWDRSFRWSLREGVQWRLLGTALLGGLAFRRRSPRTLLVGAAMLPLLYSFSVLGHISSHGPRFVGAISTVVHVGAVSVWVGGLLAMGVTLHRDRALDMSIVARTFSRLASYALVLTVAAGVSLAIIQFDDLSELWSTDYGTRLMIKMGLVWVIVCLGTVQRFGVVPRLRAERDRVAGYFSRILIAEVVAVIVILIVTAWLVAVGLATDY